MSERRRQALRMALLWVLLELLAAAQVVNHKGTSVLAGWTRAAVSPAAWTAQWIAHTTADLYHGLRDFQKVVADLRSAREELQIVKARNALLREDLAALADGHRVLINMDHLEAQSLIGRCTFRNLSRGLMEVQIPGRRTVLTNTVALSGEGVVGRVVRSDTRRSWVQLITHPAAAVAVRSADSSVQGLASGLGPGELQVEYVPRTAALLRGTILVTSGADGIYPPGIPAARVSAVRETADAFLQVSAAPVVDLSTVRSVLLLPEWSCGESGEDSW